MCFYKYNNSNNNKKKKNKNNNNNNNTNIIIKRKQNIYMCVLKKKWERETTITQKKSIRKTIVFCLLFYIFINIYIYNIT